MMQRGGGGNERVVRCREEGLLPGGEDWSPISPPHYFLLISLSSTYRASLLPHKEIISFPE